MNHPVAISHTPITLQADGIRLDGDLSLPLDVRGIVLFAHGSGSSRRSPRNRYVADLLNESGLATLLVDLLNEDEAAVDMQTAHLRFDIPLLARRLVSIAQWLSEAPQTSDLPLGLFGASTGAAAALVAAAQRPDLVRTVVSRGGRPDLAGAALAEVGAPTLLIVGGADPAVLDLNRKAMARMRCPVELEIVPGATHLFEERGALTRVATLARDWFLKHVVPPAN